MKWDKNTVVGSDEVHLETFFQTNQMEQWEKMRRDKLSAYYKTWNLAYQTLANNLAAIPPKKWGRKKAKGSLNAHVDALSKNRLLINKRIDAIEEKTFKRSGKEAWLDARHGNRSVDALTATAAELAEATLCCGFGLYRSHGMARGAIPVPPAGFLWDNTAFAATWCRRMEYFLSHIDGGLKIHDFFKWIESSDKGTISFALGGLFSYMAAKRWLQRDHQVALKGVFHYKLVNAALVSGHQNFCQVAPWFNADGETPDYVAIDSADNIYFIEAKGGEERGRHAAIHKGLMQLRAAAQSMTMLGSGLKSTVNLPVQSGLAVHTSVDAGSKIRVTAYDPPASDETQGDLHFGPYLDLPLAKCLANVELRMLFDGMDSDDGEFRLKGVVWTDPDAGELKTKVHDVEEMVWKRRGKLAFGVPASINDFLNIQSKLRIFFAIKEALPSDFVADNPELAEEPEVPWKLDIMQRALKTESLDDDAIEKLMLALSESAAPNEVLPMLTHHLGFPKVARSIKIQSEMLAQTLSDDRVKVTSMLNGLLIARPAASAETPPTATP